MASPRRNRQMIRVLRLVRHLEGLRYMPSVVEMTHMFHVHKRTLFRDLAALEEAGWQLPTRAMDKYEGAA